MLGDTRTNEQYLLITFHTLFLREHNHIARQLARINPSWDDEKLYNEARRINIAEYQHITYAEYLPNVLGRSHIKRSYFLMISFSVTVNRSHFCDIIAVIVQKVND